MQLYLCAPVHKARIFAVCADRRKVQCAAVRLTQEKFICVICGYENNADHVGAINVERAGHARIVCERTDLVSVWKQEPLLELASKLEQESPSFREGRMSINLQTVFVGNRFG